MHKRYAIAIDRWFAVVLQRTFNLHGVGAWVVSQCFYKKRMSGSEKEKE